MAVRALIFDRDGVLTYFDVAAAAAFFQPLLPISVWELAEEWQRHGEWRGFPNSLAAERHFFTGFWNELSDRFQVTAVQRSALLSLDYTRFICAFPDARRALSHARQAGYRIGVLSNFSLASLDVSLAAAGLADLVDAACAATVIGAAKPARAAYVAAATALDVEPHECLFFDDEPVCVEGARAIGMHSYLVERRPQDSSPSSSTVAGLDAVPALLMQWQQAG
ncbi:MAG: HAD-IA family hydrolase [Caldilinea sp.]